MSKVKVRVRLTEDALKGFKDIQNHGDPLVSHWGVKYLRGIVELPPKSWLDVRRRWARGVFKINDLLPFDIRGKVDHVPSRLLIIVFITRFELNKAHFRSWFERAPEKRVPNGTLGLN